MHAMFVVVLTFVSFLYGVSANVTGIYIMRTPLKGNSTQIICEIPDFNTVGSVTIHRTNTSDIPNTDSGVFECFPAFCSSSVVGRYTVAANSSFISIDIVDLNRSEDEKWWTCKAANQFGLKQTLLNVSTVPTLLTVVTAPTGDIDLSNQSATLTCSTDCAYPSVSFTWSYIEGNSGQETNSTLPTKISSTTGNCTDPEQIYTSVINMSKDSSIGIVTPVRFICKISSFPGLTLNATTNGSIAFVAKVSKVTFSADNITGYYISVPSNKSTTLTCTAGLSRPEATVVLYIGGVAKNRTKSVTTFTFTPTNDDHSQEVYCKAFNIQPEIEAVNSSKYKLYVQAKVSIVTLSADNITDYHIIVAGNKSTTLTCTAGLSRPEATVVLYIGGVENNRTYNVTTFTFTPTNENHSQEVYCKTFNIQPESEAVNSSKYKLYVQVEASVPTLTNYTSGTSLVMMSGDEVLLLCRSSPTRPTAIVSWYLGSKQLTNVNVTINTEPDSLSSVTSALRFTPTKENNNQTINCTTRIDSQLNLTSRQQPITVFYPPEGPAINRTGFPWLEQQTGNTLMCTFTDAGNPPATASWATKLGISETNDTRLIVFPAVSDSYNDVNVSCQLNNNYTKSKGVVVKSTTTLDVQYTPNVSIRVNNTLNNNVTLNEGQMLVADCTAVGNPVPTVRWIYPTSNEKLMFNNISRMDQNVYICRANASSTKYPNHSFVAELNLSVTVNYAPDVDVSLSSRDVKENVSVEIMCNATGRPAIYSYTLVQTLEGVTIPNKHVHEHGTMKIDSVQLQDSGKYICTVNNGIPDPTGKINQSAETNLTVKALPKIFIKENISAGVLGGSISLTIPFYSFPVVHNMSVERMNTNSNSRDRLQVTNLEFQITTEFYGTPVTLNGRIAQLKISNITEDDFGDYMLVLVNSIGVTTWTFSLKAQYAQVSSSTASPITPAIVGGVVGSVLAVTAIIIVLVIVFRCYNFSKGKLESAVELNQECKEKNGENDNFDEEVFTENCAYETSDNVSRDKYLQKQKHKINGIHENKLLDQDIYENAPVFARKGEFKNASERQIKGNKDELTYVHLAFTDQWKEKKKLDVHGIDNKTFYAEIDFTKNAETHPESNDEQKWEYQ